MNKNELKPNRLQIVETKVLTTTLLKFTFALSMDPFDLETRAETRKLRHHALLPNDFGVAKLRLDLFLPWLEVQNLCLDMFGNLFRERMFIKQLENQNPNTMAHVLAYLGPTGCKGACVFFIIGCVVVMLWMHLQCKLFAILLHTLRGNKLTEPRKETTNKYN